MLLHLLCVACLTCALWFFTPCGLCFAARLPLLLLRSAANALKICRIFLLFQKVGDVEKCVTLQPYIDECRLHTGKDARNTAFVNGTCEGVFVLALVVDFRELIVF
jgi:hypothetical protein